MFTHVVRRAYAKLGDKTTQKQLGKVVSIASIAVGAGMNAALMHRTADEPYYAYRERRLQDQFDLDPPDRDHDASEIIGDAEVVDDSEEPLDVIGLLKEAQRESADVKTRRFPTRTPDAARWTDEAHSHEDAGEHGSEWEDLHVFDMLGRRGFATRSPARAVCRRSQPLRPSVSLPTFS